ncbi:MAG: hypothetical protein AAGE52_35095 [Myxococcota bacterium]
MRIDELDELDLQLLELKPSAREKSGLLERRSTLLAEAGHPRLSLDSWMTAPVGPNRNEAIAELLAALPNDEAFRWCDAMDAPDVDLSDRAFDVLDALENDHLKKALSIAKRHPAVADEVLPTSFNYVPAKEIAMLIPFAEALSSPKARVLLETSSLALSGPVNAAHLRGLRKLVYLEVDEELAHADSLQELEQLQVLVLAHFTSSLTIHAPAYVYVMGGDVSLTAAGHVKQIDLVESSATVETHASVRDIQIKDAAQITSADRAFFDEAPAGLVKHIFPAATDYPAGAPVGFLRLVIDDTCPGFALIDPPMGFERVGHGLAYATELVARYGSSRFRADGPVEVPPNPVVSTGGHKVTKTSRRLRRPKNLSPAAEMSRQVTSFRTRLTQWSDSLRSYPDPELQPTVVELQKLATRLGPGA